MLIVRGKETKPIRYALDRYYVFYNRMDDLPDFPYLETWSKEKEKAIEWCNFMLTQNIKPYDKSWIVRVLDTLTRLSDEGEFVLVHDSGHAIHDESCENEWPSIYL